MAVRLRRVIAPMRCILYLLLAVCLWPLAAPHAREVSAIKADLDTKRAAYNAQLGGANAAKERYNGAEGALKVSEKAAGSRKTEMDEALAKYRKVQQLAIEHPEISPEKDRRAYAEAKDAYEKARGVARSNRQTLAAAQSNLRNEEGKLRGIAAEIETLEAEMEAERIARLRKQLEREQTVEVRGEASCGNYTIAQCKKLAMAEARRLAVERASAVIVDSASEVENFELTKDEIRTQVRGIIKSQQELESGFVGDSGYFYRIRAVVLGQLPEDFGIKRPTRGDAATDPGVAAAAIRAEPSSRVWREPITDMEFVAIPGGTYEQGCGSWTSGCYDDENPVRTVRISPVWLGKTEVTQGQWKKVMGSNPSSFTMGDDYPVEKVSWADAQDFIRRLNAQSRGVTFRLPTEAEWEYACRAAGKPVAYGTRTGQLDSNLAKYNSSDGTVAVGSFPPNGLGLHDMTGNVEEWTQRVHSDTAYRGGGWDGRPRSIRCSFRGVDVWAARVSYRGIRLARTE